MRNKIWFFIGLNGSNLFVSKIIAIGCIICNLLFGFLNVINEPILNLKSTLYLPILPTILSTSTEIHLMVLIFSLSNYICLLKNYVWFICSHSSKKIRFVTCDVTCDVSLNVAQKILLIVMTQKKKKLLDLDFEVGLPLMT